jgi:hypothetical protein
MASLVVGETKEKASALLPLPPPTIDNLSNLHCYQVTEEEATATDNYLKTYPDHSDVLPGKIIRFLRARKLNLKQTNEMLSNHLAWVEKLQPNTITVDQVDKKAMDSGCWRYVGNSLNGVPVAWVQVGKWNPHEYTVENYEVYVCYFNSMLERLMAKATQQSLHISCFLVRDQTLDGCKNRPQGCVCFGGRRHSQNIGRIKS